MSAARSALLAARVAARYGLLSKTGQKMMGTPNYDANALLRLMNAGAQNNLVRRALPGVVAGEAVGGP